MNNQLQKEILNIKKLMERLVVNESIDLHRQYKKSLNLIRKEVANIWAKYSDDEGLTISEAAQVTELKRFEKVLMKEVKKIGEIDENITTGILKKVFEESYYRTAYVIDKGVEIGINFKLLRTEFIENAISMPIKGEMFSDRIWLNKDKLVNRIRRDVKESMEKGTSLDKLARQIRDDFGSSGYESMRLIRNEVARCQSLAQEEIYQSSDVVEELLFDATLDEKTSDICQGLHGTVYKKTESHPKIPEDTHVQCRSVYIPIVKGWSPTKKRDNITKEVIDYPSNFEDWKKSKGIN